MKPLPTLPATAQKKLQAILLISTTSMSMTMVSCIPTSNLNICPAQTELENDTMKNGDTTFTTLTEWATSGTGSFKLFSLPDTTTTYIKRTSRKTLKLSKNDAFRKRS